MSDFFSAKETDGMDSLTQITLGAAVGEAILGRQLGNRAILWGAVFGTLPDLDIVMTPFVDPVEFLVHHRGLSHSLQAVAVAAPVLSWIFSRWQRARAETISYWRWFWFFLLVLLTHILLDCCTTYGTQILLPFSDVRVAWNNIFIVDPLYTVPFLGCVATCLFLRRTSRWRRRLNYIGLVVSTGYLALTGAVKFHVDHVFADALARQGIPAERWMTCPTPLNAVLWCGIAESDRGYHVGFRSLLDSGDEIRFRFVPRREELLGSLAGTYGVQRLIWFADGYYSVRPHPQGVLLDVLKFGTFDVGHDQEYRPFSYLIRGSANPGITIERYEPPREPSLRQFAGRLWTRLKGH